ncbi:GNAT family N-acetyltransferase [Sphaerisporangium aureirubrum]|uniref:GNAT family N-acetyltransferase n=1 Tax=Sphaerisporangium aureirubrum TaxID=1544736 RepID=A0ABW1NLD6_9ACTN
MTGIRPMAAGELDAIAGLAWSALTLDSAEASALVARLAAPPPERDWAALVTPDLDGVVFVSTSATEGIGHLDLFAVHPAVRGRGLGKALVWAAEEWLRDRGVREARMAGNPPCYAWPGIDVRYTPAVCLAESLGYRRYRTAWNMTADLTSAAPPREPELARLAEAGVELHAAPPGAFGERAEVAAFVREQWNDAWAWEVEQATGCHYAVRDGEILGFAAWGSRPRWFGPMGTAESARGLGVGRVLLRRCLAEQAAYGLKQAQIGWVGPIRFYAKAIGAPVERVFWLFRRSLDGPDLPENEEP